MTDPPQTPAPVTQLLRRWQEGDRTALDLLIPLVYDELHRIASRYLAREWREGALQTTALVNEAYLKLVDQRQVDWQNRAQFFAIAAQLIRRILVDDARRRLREKRGGDAPRVSLEDGMGLPAPEGGGVDAIDVIAVDRALQRLESTDAGLAKVVELRFFSGMTVEETASVLQVSAATIKRDWAVAKAFLYRELTGGTPQP
jgi:RNA polymerase sigma-70 factor (ECF subfamily)